MSTQAGYFKLDTTVVQGDDKPYTILFKENGVPVDISTWLFFHTVKAAFADADADALSTLDPTDFTVSNGNGTNDKLTFSVPKAATALMDVASHHQDLQVNRAGIISTYGKGDFVVEEQVTIRTAPLP